MLLTHIKFCRQKLIEEVEEHWLLIESFFVALSLHVAFVPVLWTIGWALPWPKPPVFTVTVEYELDKSSLTYKPKGLTEYRDPKLNP